jgi:ubiquinone/menaquinone biosynthesis C-methylase UbiE
MGNDESGLKRLDFGERHVATLFNEMAGEYDQLEDEWYPHLFRQIEWAILTHFKNGAGKKAMDVGCGTGFQTLPIQALGYETVGIDIAADLVRCARAKALARNVAAQFVVASAVDIPFPAGTFDLVNCSGSTLSFIADYERALTEMARVLKPGGHLILEVEQRWNLDLLWALLDGLIGGRLGYEQSVSESWGNLMRPCGEGIVISYPFTRLDGSVDYLPLRCFTLHELTTVCTPLGLRVTQTYGVHVITNLIPSTLLGDPGMGPRLRAMARSLARVDNKVKAISPFDRLGCSLITIFRKGTDE